MRSRNISLILAVLTVFLFTGTALCADVAKVGLVDFQRLFDQSKAGKSVKKEITAKGKKMEAELNKKGAEIEELKKRLERESLVMSKEVREEKEREFRIKINDIKTLKKKYEVDLQRTQKELLQGLQTQTVDIIKEIGKSGGYLLIMEKRGILYSPSTIDITDEVIKKFDKVYKKK